MEVHVLKRMGIKQRWAKVKEQHACHKCLSITHKPEACPRNERCGAPGCNAFHHKLLHEDRAPTGGDARTPVCESVTPRQEVPAKIDKPDRANSKPPDAGER